MRDSPLLTSKCLIKRYKNILFLQISWVKFCFSRIGIVSKILITTLTWGNESGNSLINIRNLAILVKSLSGQRQRLISRALKAVIFGRAFPTSDHALTKNPSVGREGPDDLGVSVKPEKVWASKEEREFFFSSSSCRRSKIFYISVIRSFQEGGTASPSLFSIYVVIIVCSRLKILMTLISRRAILG